MKAIMISIKPRHNKNILNGIKTLEIRKKFPKDYVGWVYIYNTKDIKDGYLTLTYIGNKLEFITAFNHHPKYQGKVVARFWCDKVEELTFLEGLYDPLDRGYCTDTLDNAQVEIKSCVPQEKIIDYLYSKGKGYAIHITKLEIFDKPKEISGFKSKLHIKGGCKNCPQNTGFSMPYCATCDFLLPLNRAPQSWCYVEE